MVWEASQGLAEVIPANPSTAGEDFAFYQERIPGVLPLSVQMESRMRQTSIMIT